MEKEVNLKELSEKFLVSFLKNTRKDDFKLLKDVSRLSKHGEKYKLDFLIIDNQLEEEIGAVCKDWKRSIAINVVNTFVDKIQRLGLSMGIMIGKQFSDPARSREENCDNLLFISKEEMETYLKTGGKGSLLGDDLKDFKA